METRARQRVLRTIARKALTAQSVDAGIAPYLSPVVG
jgi:hypothetical protein